MRVAIISDIHAYETAKKKPSYIGINDSDSDPEKHPIAGLKKLFKDELLEADIILCPGDLTDRAQPSSLQYVWSALQSLKVLLGAKFVYATVGNHDVDSRYTQAAFDPIQALKDLNPLFPGLDDSVCDHFWSKHFATVEYAGARILIINSSAYHGQGKTQKAELSHGRISDKTVRQIAEILKSQGEKQINILLCHHHLYKDNAAHESDYSEMSGADHLLRLLGAGEFGQWLIIHGHKHHPKLQYATGGMISPIILGAGSLSACLYEELAALARNQFYMLELDIALAETLQMDVAGHVRAWDWIPNRGWQPAGDRSGLPSRSGFGYRASIGAIASRIAKMVEASGTFMAWSEITQIYPEVNFLLPRDIAAVCARLESRHKIKNQQDATGAILQMAKS